MLNVNSEFSKANLFLFVNLCSYNLKFLNNFLDNLSKSSYNIDDLVTNLTMKM